MSRPVQFAAIVPVKALRAAKSRLQPMPDAARAQLAQAFALDAIAAVSGCQQVSSVWVATDEHDLAVRLRQAGVHCLPDAGDDLNQILAQTAAEADRATPGIAVFALCGDLPSLHTADVEGLLARCPPASSWFVRDRAGAGTTFYGAPCSAMFTPSFGRDSARQHTEARAVELDVDPRARQDVDTPADLEAALDLGVGAHTRVVVKQWLGNTRTSPRP